MNRARKVSVLDLATVAFMVACCLQPVGAGTQGSYMNSAGYGKAVDSVVFAGVTNTASSVAMYYPCAGVNPQAFTCNALYTKPLPAGAPASTYCQSRGASNYRWSIQSEVTGGATADNPELENRIPIVPSNCASYSLESDAAFTDAYSGLITVNAVATAGAAVWLRGFEYTGPGQPSDLADLIANGALKWDILVPGPFEYSTANCTALTIPFTTQTGHANLYFVADGVAKSTPFSITCPGNLQFGCTDPVVYPAAQVSGGCGAITVTYNPPANLLPAGVTSVTATATDEAGNAAQCTFTAERLVLAFDGFQSPINGTGGTCLAPLRSINLGSKIPVKFKVTCAGSPLTTGQPTLSIQQCSGGNYSGGGDFQLVANEWHFNWDTSGLRKGTYELVTTLQDGSQRGVFVRLK